MKETYSKQPQTLYLVVEHLLLVDVYQPTSSGQHNAAQSVRVHPEMSCVESERLLLAGLRSKRPRKLRGWLPIGH